MTAQTDQILAAAANSLTLAVSQDHPVYEITHRNIYEIAGAFLGDYLPYIDETVSDEELDRWLNELIRHSRMLDPALLKENPYIRTLQLHNRRIGRYQLAESCYEAGEILIYDMPLLQDGRIIPRIGCFPERVFFPSVYEDGIPWMSVIPSEIFSMQEDLAKVKGKVLVLGLGLGYFAMMAALKENTDEVTVIEKSAEIIDLFEQEILPCFAKETQKKIHVIHADAFEYLNNLKETCNYCYCDLWFSQADGHDLYLRLTPYEQRFPKTEFLYWIRGFLK